MNIDLETEYNYWKYDIYSFTKNDSYMILRSEAQGEFNHDVMICTVLFSSNKFWELSQKIRAHKSRLKSMTKEEAMLEIL